MFDSATYQRHRQALRNKVQNGIILILGNNEAPANYPDNTYKFRQDSSFLYFFGHSHPGYAGVIDIEAGEDYFFGNDVDMDDIIWMGPQPSVKELAAQVGIQKSFPFPQLKEVVGKAIAQGRKVHFLPPYRFDNMMLLEDLTGIRAAIVKKYASVELIKAVVDLRSVKEACEIAEIDLACNIGYEMHTAAMRLCKPGIKEQYIAGVLDGIAASYGSMTSFATILTQHGETLHNHDHSHILEVGRMMLTDAGAERLSNYCSDLTRTVPVGGKFQGRKKTNAVSSGDICAVVGVEGFEIGDTICDFENPEPLPPIAIDEPTMSMLFTINDSPFFGKEGKFVTSRHIQDRLTKELDKNLALRVRKSELEDGKWIVSGRGVLHLSVLIETMRREGYELQVGQPQVIFKEIDGVKCEPIEELTISVPEEYSSKMIDMVTRRKGDLVSMETQGDRVNIEFDMPSRGIIGLRTNVLTASAGEAIMAHRFKCYQPYKGEIERRSNGSMIAMESGTAFAYAIDKLQDRGKFFIYPQDEVYAGQVVGEHVHENDLVINVTKSKKLTNMRASGSDDKARIIPPVVFSLEEALEYIKEDEYVEVTPKSMRMRKVILDETERKRANKS